MSPRPPITHDPEVHQQLRRAYPNLLDGRELHVQGAYINDSTCLGILCHGEKLIVIQAHQESLDPGHGRDHPFLDREEGRALQHYQLAHPCIAWPQPILNVALTGPGEGVVTGSEPSVPINLRRAGEAQLWWGGEVGEIWEATLEGVDLETDPTPLHALWYALETSLRERGCARAYTLADNPDHDDADYLAFLAMREYTPDPSTAEHPHRVWTKALD